METKKGGSSSQEINNEKGNKKVVLTSATITPKSNLNPETTAIFQKNYQVKETILDESHASLKIAVDTRTNKRVLLRVIKKARSPIAEVEAELQTLMKVSGQNKHIIKLYDVIDTGDQVVLVTQLTKGGTLFDRVVERGSYPEAEAKKVIKNLLSAVKVFHDNEVVNRGINPENLSLRSKKDDTSVIVSNFGVAKSIRDEQMMQTSCGSPCYAAPEVVNALGYGKPVDLWSVGIIAYILLSGIPPFISDSIAVLLEQISEAKVDYPPQYWSNISEAGINFVKRLLTEDPDKRMTADQALQHEWLKGV
eukprot:TRINITY_DN422_c0_g1_i2.p1 TRINITY_DN422_c0_g1~~TRINITY_DN422_c0_g1_i2.p1  ORF type:complete len:307 (-),score=55.10 TRINITY_DN422_c0_g1_i2:863-1783(-)